MARVSVTRWSTLKGVLTCLDPMAMTRCPCLGIDLIDVGARIEYMVLGRSRIRDRC